MDDVNKQQEELKQNQADPSAPQGGEKQPSEQNSGGQEEKEDLKQEEPSSDPQGGKSEGEDYYKQELERVQKERDNYKQGLLNKKDEIKKAKGDNPSLTQEQVEELVNQKLEEQTSTIRDDLFKNQVDNALGSMTSDENKKELIRHHYNNSIQKTGDISVDLKRALLLTDENKIFRDNEEMRQSLTAQQSIGNTSYGSTAKRGTEEDVQPPKLTEGEQKLIDRINRRRQANGGNPMSNEEIRALKQS